LRYTNSFIIIIIIINNNLSEGVGLLGTVIKSNLKCDVSR